MAGAQDGTFACLGHMEGTTVLKFDGPAWLLIYTVYASDTLKDGSRLPQA